MNEFLQQTKTPMSDHVARFWQLLETEFVHIVVNIQRLHDEGQPPHWDSASFGNDVAKALAAAQSRAPGEGEWQVEGLICQFGELIAPEDDGRKKLKTYIPPWSLRVIARYIINRCAPALYGGAQVTEKMLIAASLAWCNELRKQNGLASTDRTEMSQDARDIIKAALTAALASAQLSEPKP